MAKFDRFAAPTEQEILEALYNLVKHTRTTPENSSPMQDALLILSKAGMRICLRE
jgi:hypothetical protein